MKSFSQFNNLIEAKGEGVIPDNVEQGKKVLKKINQQKEIKTDVWGNDPNKTPTIADIERESRGKKGEEVRKTVEKQSKNIDKGQNRLLDRVNDPNKNRPTNVKKGELGRLYRGGSDEYGYEGVKDNREGSTRTNAKINKELQAKRAARIDPKTGKATQKGVENFAINKLTKGLSTKGPTGRQQLANAKKLASNPGSAAYKKIESDINTSDYAGKRAKLASADELKKIKTDIKSSSTIGDKPSQANIKVTKPNTATIKSTNPNINNRTFGGPVRSKYGKIRPNLWKKVKPTVKPPSTSNLNPDQVLSRNMGASGMDSNVSGSQPITKSTTKPNITKPAGQGFYTGGKHQTPGGTNVTSNLSSNVRSTGMDSNVSGQVLSRNSGKTFKQFKNISGKTSNVAKLKVTPKNLAGRVTGPAFAAWNAIDNYKAAKGSPLRKAVKSAVTTTAYYKGFAGGAALGTAGGSFTGPGAFVTGTAGGILGGDLAQKTAGSLFNKVWKPPTKTKTKTSSTTNNKGVGGNGKKDMKWTPMRGGVRLGSGPD